MQKNNIRVISRLHSTLHNFHIHKNLCEVGKSGIIFTHFANEERESQKGRVTGSRSWSWLVFFLQYATTISKMEFQTQARLVRQNQMAIVPETAMLGCGFGAPV